MAILFFIHGFIFLCVAAHRLISTGSFKNRILGGAYWIAYSLITMFGTFFSLRVSGTIFFFLVIVSTFLSPETEVVRPYTIHGRKSAYLAFGPLALGSGAVLISILLLQVPAVIHYFREYGNTTTQVAVAASTLTSLVLFAIASRTHPILIASDTQKIVTKIGPSLVLPQVLAVLGSALNSLMANIGSAGLTPMVVSLTDDWFALLYLGICSILSGLTGSSFAAFPIAFTIAALPLLSIRNDVPPASLATLGMLAGFCGTLISPLAANFNRIPATLLGINKLNAIIVAQLPTALSVVAFIWLRLHFMLRH